MVPANKIKIGMIFSIDGELLRVLSSDYHSSGKMVTSAYAKFKNLKTGAFVEKHFKPDERLEEIHFDRKDHEFLYADGNDYYFMNPDTFEQVLLTKEVLGTGSNFLQPNTLIPILFYEEKAVGATLPDSVQLKVTLTAPAQQQDNSTMKTAVLEGGIETLVPQFIKTGDKIKIDIQSNKYLERIKDKD